MLESLFTNVPLGETIATIFKKVYVEKKIKTLIPKLILKELLLLCKKHLHLRFNAEIYTEIDEVAMGSPLDSLLAIIFMISLEEEVLLKYITIYVIGNVMLITLKRMLFLKRLILFQKNQILIILILNSSMN